MANMFAEFEDVEFDIVDDIPEVSVLLKWTVPFGVYKGRTYGAVVLRDSAWLRNILKWKALEPRSRTIIERVLAAWDEHTQTLEPEEPDSP